MFDTSSGTQTELLGAQLARRLVPGDVVTCSGELGAGKTTLIRGAARALGVGEVVTSPTFTIGQRYPAAAPVTYVAHVDLYRVRSLVDEDPGLLADYIRDDTITFIEWPEVGMQEIAELGRIALRVRIQHAGGDERRIEVDESL
ncbi:MAG: tRNA (adenosine(37)-N6)-threonylcarbamoyltransferase complex ATPase subunit type 1 TsaE [Solirubrobacteraceae bacterium]